MARRPAQAEPEELHPADGSTIGAAAIGARPRGRPRQGQAVARHLPRNEELVHIAAEVFFDLGFERTKMADIARRAGIVPGSIYHYFSSKEEIYQRMVELIRAKVTAGSETDDVEDPRERLIAIVRNRLETISRHPIETALLRRTTRLEGELGEWAREFARGELLHFRRLIIQGQRAHRFRPGDPDVMARVIIFTLTGIAESFRPDAGVDVDDLVEEVLAFILGGIDLPAR